MLREFTQGNSLDLRRKELTDISPRLWNEAAGHIQVLDLSQNPALGDSGIPADLSLMVNLRSLRLEQCNIHALPDSLLASLINLQSLEVSKNYLTQLFSGNVKPNWPALNYLNLNGNKLVVVPPICKDLPALKQLHLHMNHIGDVRELCRPSFAGLEILDLGGNKVSELPGAFMHFCKSLIQVTLTNNDLNRLPGNIGVHPAIKVLNVDGNPLRSIRRPIIDGGSARLLKYLADKFNPDADGKIEEWALEQEKEDTERIAAREAELEYKR